ncbi:MAG: ATP-binding protein, partial [Clostridia bacterium]|nr:ATP-binding protein [Clostridia bacterium]
MTCRANQFSKYRKNYLSDISIKYSQMGFDREKLSAKFENIILLEMKRRGYDVNIGKNNTKEIDFVGVRRDENIYPSLCGT